MPYADYIRPDRIMFLKSETKEEAFAELVNLVCIQNPKLKFSRVLNEVWQRENLATTKVAAGIAIPHAKINDLERPIIVVGRSLRGIYYDTGDEDRVNLFVMIVSNSEKYLAVLSGIAARLNDGWTYNRILEAKTPKEIYELLVASRHDKGGGKERARLSRSMLAHACELYRETQAKVLVVYADAVSDIATLLNEFGDERVCLVTHDPEKHSSTGKLGNIQIVQVPYGSLSRAGQIELTHLFIAARGFVKKRDKVISVYGKKDSGVFDTVMVADIESEFSGYLSVGPQILPADLKQEVFARAVQLANDLAYEGREGKPLGTIFVLGDHEAVANYCQQMVVNPFQGLADGERNILDPSLEETIKEFSKLDGAFVVRGDGVVVTSGAYLSTHRPELNFQQGLGARHAAAASVTSATKALAVVLSESTRKVSIFKSGRRFIVF